jgi:Phospholipase_D-nuclease N-terminal
MFKKKKQKRWSQLSPATKTGVVVGGLAELVVTAVALRDLVRRPAAQVRGPKPLWGVGLFVQPVGSPLYLLVGRRHATA